MLLRPLGVSDEEQALQAHEELAQEGFEFLFEPEPGAAWPAYCRRLESQRLGVDLPEGRVPATFLVAEAEGQLVGRVSIRHELNAYLTEVGGAHRIRGASCFSSPWLRDGHHAPVTGGRVVDRS